MNMIGRSRIRKNRQKVNADELKPMNVIVDSIQMEGKMIDIQIFENRKQGIKPLTEKRADEGQYVSMLVNDKLTCIVLSNGQTPEEAAKNGQLTLKISAEKSGNSVEDIPSVEEMIADQVKENLEPWEIFILPCSYDLYHSVDLIEKSNRMMVTPDGKPIPLTYFITCRLAKTLGGKLIAIPQEMETSPSQRGNLHVSLSGAAVAASED